MRNNHPVIKNNTLYFGSMFFLIFYLESRLRWMQMRYCKAILQFGLFMLAALTGLSRISDHKVFHFISCCFPLDDNSSTIKLMRMFHPTNPRLFSLFSAPLGW